MSSDWLALVYFSEEESRSISLGTKMKTSRLVRYLPLIISSHCSRILEEIHYNMRMEGQHTEEEMEETMARLEAEFPLFQQDFEEGIRIRASITEEMEREANNLRELDYRLGRFYYV